MNPFVQSTVARGAPLSHWRGPQASSAPPSGPRVWRQALGVLLLTAGLGLAAPPARAVDVNQASAAQLETLRGIGPRTAEIIVRERERGGQFESIEDLSERVRGIGQKKAQALQAAGMTVGVQPGVTAPTAPAASATAPVPAAKPAQARPAATRPAGAAAASARPKP